MKRLEKILYLRTDRMGDVLMNLPALSVLRQSYPKAWLTLACDRSVADLFKGQPELDEVMELDTAGLMKSAPARREFVRKVRSIRYDLVIVSNPSKFFHWLSFSARIPLRVGWRRKWAFLLNRTLPDQKNKKNSHEIDSNLELVRLVTDKPWDGRARLSVNEGDAKSMKERLDGVWASGGVIAIHTGTSNDAKRWPKENFLSLCQKIEKRGKDRILFVGGAEEAAVANEIALQLERPSVQWCGATNLKELGSFFADGRVRALVSADSGPVHVAWMSGTPVVALYAKGSGSDPVRWGPRDEKSRVIFKTIGSISPEEVFVELETLLK